MAILLKQPSNITWDVSIRRVSAIFNAPKVGILYQSDTDTQTKVLYDTDSLDDVQNQSEHDAAGAVLSSTNYVANGDSVELIPYSSQTTPNVATQGTNSGATTTVNPTSGIINAVKKTISDGYRYLVTADDVSESDIEQLSDDLYDTQRVMLVTQLHNIDDMNKLKAHIKSYQNDENKLCNTAYIYVTNGSNESGTWKYNAYPAASAAGFAATNLPVSFAHIGDQPGFAEAAVDPSGNSIDNDTLQQVSDAGGIAVVNLAGDNMLSSGTTAGGNYIDEFVNYQYTMDYYTYALQKWLNNQKYPKFDDSTIALIEQVVKFAGQQLQKMDLLAGPIEVNTLKSNELKQNDINQRVYKGLSLVEHLSGTIDSMKDLPAQILLN